MTSIKIDLSDEVYKQLQTAADELGITLAELIRRALNLEEVVRQSGEKIYIGNAEQGEIRELQVA